MNETITDRVTKGGRAWRDAWKKAAGVSRSEAREAVDNGVAVPRAEYAALAAGLAAREYSQTRFVGLAGAVAAGIFLVLFLVFAGPTEVFEMVKGGGGSVLIGLMGSLFWLKARKARRALAQNLELLSTYQGEVRVEDPPRRTKQEIRREQLLGLLLAVPVLGGWFLVYSLFSDRGVLFTFGAAVIYFALLGALPLFALLLWARARR